MPNWSDFEVTIEGELSVIKGLYDQYLANDKKFLDTLVPEPEELHKKIQSILLTAVDTSNLSQSTHELRKTLLRARKTHQH